MKIVTGFAQLAFKSLRKNPEAEEERSQRIKKVAGSSEYEDKEAAVKYLEEIAETFDEEFYRFSAKIVEGYLARFFEIVVEGDVPQQSGNLIFISNHRSMMDFLLKGVVLDKKGVSAPRYSAGKNLFFPLLVENILRKWGAVCIDRSKRSRAYLEVVRDYYTQLILEGDNLIIYPEAGRSYDGGFKKLRRGLIQAIERANEQKPDLDITIIPTTVSYTRVPEDYLLAKSGERGKDKKRMLSDGLSSLDTFFLRPPMCGNAYLTFGAPFSIGDLQGEITEEIMEITEREFRRLYKVTSTQVAAYSLQEGSVSEVEFYKRFKSVVEKLIEGGVNIESGMINLDEWEILESPYVQRLMAMENRAVIPKNPELVKYYANSVKGVLNEN